MPLRVNPSLSDGGRHILALHRIRASMPSSVSRTMVSTDAKRRRRNSLQGSVALDRVCAPRRGTAVWELSFNLTPSCHRQLYRRPTKQRCSLARSANKEIAEPACPKKRCESPAWEVQAQHHRLSVQKSRVTYSRYSTDKETSSAAFTYL